MNLTTTAAFSIALIATLAKPLAAWADPKTAIPSHPWGIYCWWFGKVDRAEWPADFPVKGIPLVWQWARLEPQPGKYEFDLEALRQLQALKTRGLYTHVMLWVAPCTPEWLYAMGVPKVEVPERISPFRTLVKPTFPYYFSPIYKEHFHRTIQALGDYIAKLPADLKERIVFVQVAEGSTGDDDPYKGTPIDPRYTIGKEDWGKFRRETWTVYQCEFQRADGSLRVPLLVNGLRMVRWKSPGCWSIAMPLASSRGCSIMVILLVIRKSGWPSGKSYAPPRVHAGK